MWTFIAANLGWVLTLGASLGGVAVLVAVLVFGLPVAVMVSSALGVLKELVAFLRTPAGQAVAIVAIFVAGLVIGDVHRTRLEVKHVAAVNAAWKAKWDKAAADAEATRATREADVASFAKAEERRRADDLQRRADDLSNLVADYEKSLAAAARPACRLGADDVERLRRIK